MTSPLRADAATPPRWVFDELPPSGARRGGNPAEHAFRPDLDSFVREVVQNANDQRITAPEVRFAFTSLEGESLRAFHEACSWETLEPHLAAAGHERGGRAIARALGELRHSKKLLVLHVEDRHTVGLTGDESEGESHFRALCKDTLYSHKRAAGAGGSFGLGKSVLWTFSGLSTVLFASVLAALPRGRRSPRLIGRAELPSHAIGRKGYAGSGWFGVETRLGRGQRRAESVWGLEAAVQARMLHLERAAVSGTSILVVGFRDPTRDEEETVAALEERIRRAAATWFWPALAMPSGALRVVVGGSVVEPQALETIAPFLACWRMRTSPRETLEEPGDVVVRRFVLDLPARRDGKGGGKVSAALYVRLADERARDALLGHVACFRGAGMVVRYWDRSALASARPFHALLACGHARDPESPTEADAELERFLRDAEPPGHDDWVSTPALKDGWKRGYAKAIDQLRDCVSRELREALSPRSAVGARGPERLARRFPIGGRGGRGGSESAFRFSGLRAWIEDGAWRFAGTLAATRTDVAWRGEVRLSELGEDGAPLGDVPVDSAWSATLGVRLAVRDGVLELECPAGIPEAQFEGRSASLPESEDLRGELGLDVAGTLGPEAP